VSLSVEGIATGERRPHPTSGQGDLMNAGKMQLQMTIPIQPPDFSLHYSGSLGAMDLTRLDAFLEMRNTPGSSPAECKRRHSRST